MQEEVNEKTVALCIKGGKISADILKSSLMKLLREMERAKAKKEQERPPNKPEVVKHGKQNLQKMMDSGSQLTNIEITDNNIRSFERVARKYGIDYSLKKDKSTDPPRYLVFFRAKDTDVMTAAFKEYTAGSMEKEKKRPSMLKRLKKAVELSAKHKELEKTKDKDRGQSL